MWEPIQFVLFTATVTVGVDPDEVHFDFVMGWFDGYGCTFRDLMQMMYRGGRRGIGTGPGQLGCSEMLLLCKHDTRQAVSDAVRERGIERLAREVDKERRLGVQQ